MQHLQYGMGFLLKFATALRLPLLRGISRHTIFSVHSVRPVKLASTSSPWRLPAPQIWLRLTMRVLQMFLLYLLYCIVLYLTNRLTPLPRHSVIRRCRQPSLCHSYDEAAHLTPNPTILNIFIHQKTPVATK